MTTEATTPYRPLPMAPPAPVHCRHCVSRSSERDGDFCRLHDVLAPPPNHIPLVEVRYRPRMLSRRLCDDVNARRDCADFTEKPLSWWERIFGRRYP